MEDFERNFPKDLYSNFTELYEDKDYYLLNLINKKEELLICEDNTYKFWEIRKIQIIIMQSCE